MLARGLFRLSAVLLGACALLALTAGCGDDCIDDETEAVHVRADDPEGELEDLVAHPWPSDARRRNNGSLDLDAFPNPTESSTLEEYLEIIGKETKGFSVSAASYVGFSGPIDPASLPADVRATLEPGASVSLVDIDEASPERGKKIPLRLRYSDPRTLYLPANHLIAIPPYGATLRNNTTYALLLTNQVRARSGEALVAARHTRNALRASCEDATSGLLFRAFAPLREWLADEGTDPEEVAGATVFTTQDALGRLEQLVGEARKLPLPPIVTRQKLAGSATIATFRVDLDLPGFQEGTLPYRSIEDGGAIPRDANGVPYVTHQERARVGIAVPKRAGPMPANGWPVILYSHGTGGNYQSAFSSEVAGELGALGIAIVGYDQTLHGPRDPTRSDPSLTFFNLGNPVAARDNVLQGAVDCTVMTSLIANGGLDIPAEENEGEAVRFDPNRMAFVGHSQGAIVGAVYWAMEERMKAVVFSGLGAILAVTLQERTDPVDFNGLLRDLLGLDSPNLQLEQPEVLDDFNPVVNVIQTFIEPADPITYAKSYYDAPPKDALRDLLHVEGFLDHASPARGQEAFASAAGVPLIAPAHRVPEVSQLQGPAPQEAPAVDNIEIAQGRVTAGLIQYPERDHWPIFNDRDANARFVEFVRSALIDGQARIIASE